MQKTSIIFLSVFIIVFFSCKKKEVADADPSGTPINNVAPNDSSNYTALFSCLNVFAKNSGSFTASGKLTSAYYSSQLIYNESYTASNLQNMGSVSLNGVVFKNKNAITNYYYNDSTATQFTLPNTWSVTGTSSINTFSFSNTNSLPTYTASANLPDSIKISTGFSFFIKGTTNCNLIRVFVQGGTGSTSYPSKLISGTDSIISFSANELQGLNPTNTGYISIQLYKDNYRLIAGKRINFRTGLQYYNAFLKIKL